MLNSWTIQTLCGPEAYKIGREYYRLGLVTGLEQTGGDRYEAVVDGRKRYGVTVEFDDKGSPDAKCGCPSFFAHFHYCSHIAAVLFQILAEEEEESNISRGEGAAASSGRPAGYPAAAKATREQETRVRELIALFSETGSSTFKLRQGPAAPARYVQEQYELLQLEFTCHLEAGFLSAGNPRFLVSLKAGAQRLYAVRDIRLFLEHVEQNKALPVSKNFTYDPARHRFREADVQVLKELISVYSGERVYDFASGLPAGTHGRNKTSAGQLKQLLVPPYVWEKLAPVLEEAGAVLEQPGGFTAPLMLSAKKPPIMFELKKQEDGGNWLEAECLEETVLLPDYECAVFRGNVYRMDSGKLALLKELKQTFYRSDTDFSLEIPESGLEEFTRQVIPRLKGLGTVSIDRSIETRIIQPKLQAKLFLDRLEDELHIRLEYHYSGIIIFPLGREERDPDREEAILLRDVEKEQLIFEPFARLELEARGNEWIAASEEAIYEVLFRLLPRVEALAEVFATQAVRDWVHQGADTFHTLADADLSLNWLEFTFSMDGIPEKEIRKLLLAVVERKHYYRLPGGAFVNLDEEGFSAFAGLYKDLGLHKSDLASSIRVPLVRAFYMEEAYGRKFSRGRALTRFLEHVKDPGRLEFHLPSGLEAVLRDYQKQGFEWLKTLAHFRFGGILADDMGLGKTLQTIAFLLSERREAERGPEAEQLPALVVSPASLIYNWENEFLKFAPELKVKVIAGTREEREKELGEERAQVDVLITSYPLLRRDVQLYEALRFGTMILDEAQAFKNHATQTALTVKQIPAGRRFALTGTPVENSLDELWSIMDAVFPDLFTGRKAFRDMPRDRLARAVRPFILRRVKSDVLSELPEKIESTVSSELTLEQKKLYAAYLKRLQKETEEDLELSGFQKSRLKILAGITRLRQLCCHPGLFVEDYEGTSGKLEQLMEIVDECLASGKRMLIFSQFTGMLAKIQHELAVRGIFTFYLDGQTPAKERVELCARFNEGEADIFLISLKAGGTGLNLTGADTVVLFDLWWNPAVEEQAVGRAHRIGQRNSVQVIRLTAKGTIEDKMLELQRRKKDLIEDVIGTAGEGEGEKAWTEQDIRELLMLPKSMEA